LYIKAESWWAFVAILKNMGEKVNFRAKAVDIRHPDPFRLK